jgi:predicted  nucleic acid-binding Zn-ribbon protein
MAKKAEAKAEKKESAKNKAKKVSSTSISKKTGGRKSELEEKIVKTSSKRETAIKKEVTKSLLTERDGDELTVEEKLLMLYKLQTVVTEIDKIKTLRGELPLEVQDLEDEIVGLKTRLEKYQAEVQDLEDSVNAQKNKISESKILIDRHKAQLEQVRNNREFDNLSKEIEFEELEIEFAEKKTKEFNVTIKQKKADIEMSKQFIEERKGDLDLKKKELHDIVSETRQEEEKLRDKAKALEGKIESHLLNAFKRIRKGARNGLAIVNIERDACGGCFNKIPPQKQLDIKLHKKIIVCEYCGRIMIDPELAHENITQ